MGRPLRLAVTGIGLVAVAPVLGAVIPGPVQRIPPLAGPPVTIGLVQGPIHTDLLLPLDPATRQAFAEVGPPDGAQWLAVGWGARGFYTTVGDYDDLTLPVIAAAATGDSAVMRYQPVAGFVPPQTLTLGVGQYAALTALIRAQTGAAVARDLLGPGDAYFTAPGRFSVVNTCNQWIGRSLRASGQRFGIWTPTTWSVRLSHWWFAPSPSR